MPLLRPMSAAIVLACATWSLPCAAQAEGQPNNLGMARQFAECAAMYSEFAAGDQGTPAIRQATHNMDNGARLAAAWILFIFQSSDKPLTFFTNIVDGWREEFQTKHAASMSLAANGGPDAIKRLAADREALTKLCFSLQDLQEETINQARKAALGQQ